MVQVDLEGNFERLRHLHIADNIKILRNMRSESVDLIYLDPPFNSNRDYNNALKSDKKKLIQQFKDTWTLDDLDFDERLEVAQLCPQAGDVIDVLHNINGEAWFSYLTMMAARLIELRRVLKNTGSIYLHVDPTMSHGLKMIMDAIFNIANYRNEIVWSYSGGGVPKKDFARKHDIILRYSKSDDYMFNVQYRPYAASCSGRHSDGSLINKKRGAHMQAVWTDLSAVNTQSKERTGYPTQKPITLLERIIKASSNKGDIVLDPFCGCATTLIAAEKLGRSWIGIDVNENAKVAIAKRMRGGGEDNTLWDDFNQYEENPKGKLYVRNDLDPFDKDRVRANLYSEQNKKCAGCFAQKELGDMHLDHIVPRARGGQNERRNLQLLCLQCNTSKGAMGETEWQRRIQKELAEKLVRDFVDKRQEQYKELQAKGTKKR